MKKTLPILVVVVLALATVLFLSFYVKAKLGEDTDNPWSRMPRRPSHTDHTKLFKGKEFNNGPAVTRACLECHPDAAKQIMQTAHWNWVGEEVLVPGHDQPMRIGKKNLLNNYCVGIQSNYPKCTKCHAGYGWSDASFDFTVEENVDCLVCHDQTNQYVKGDAGFPVENVDLFAAAQSVGLPTRQNCGWCHFNGGGGDAVKHGDLDGSMAKPVERIDVHMGRHDFQCIDCHQTENHRIPGRSMSVSITGLTKMACTNCHAESPHGMERLNKHSTALACQACHLPKMAVKEPTKIAWDWSTAGQDTGMDDPHVYLKTKGSFIYAKNAIPEYYWLNGSAFRYIQGDSINPHGITNINFPRGDIRDPDARIWPFKVHRAKQPYDQEHGYLLVPKTVGKGGYWTDFDWDKAVELASFETGLPYSGELGFTETAMYWPLSHMIAKKERALQCIDCHGDNTRLDWVALGYREDPAFSGGREYRRIISTNKTNER